MKINLTLELDENRFSKGTDIFSLFKQVLYTGAYINKNCLKILNYKDDRDNKTLKTCNYCSSVFYPNKKSAIDDLILCDNCIKNLSKD